MAEGRAVAGSVGEKIGEGVHSDVHAWAPGYVVKLFKPSFPRRSSSWEARMTRAVFAAGAPAPEVLEEVTLEGRHGIVLQRLEGPTLLSLSRDGSMTAGQVGAVLAELCLSVHQTTAPPEVPLLRERMHADLRHAPGAFPEHVAADLLALVDSLPTGNGLCHGDVHPGNVIMTPEGPRFIDWIGATRAPPPFDLACCHVIHADLAAAMVGDPARPRANDAAMQSEYARLAGMDPATLTAAMAAYVPVIRAYLLLGPAGSPALRERLLREIEAAMCAAGWSGRPCDHRSRG
jgi:Ser/Thr protein kinase RdoA (MazF antagonist)